MATKKKLLQAAAGTAAASGGAGGLNVEDVFSTYLYEGNGSSQAINNGIELGDSTVLLLQDSFVDQSAIGNSITTSGDVSIDTSVKKYGSGSLEFNQTTTEGHISLTNTDNFKFGSSPMTVEFWMYPTSTHSTEGQIIGDWTTGGGTGPSNWTIYIQSSVLKFQVVNAGNTGADQGYTLCSASVSINTWTHVAATFDGTYLRLFINGTLSSTQTFSSGFSVESGSYSSNIDIGDFTNFSGYSYRGYLDDIRVTKGLARYTATFTPPSAAFELTGEGGLVWVKERTALSTGNHELMDTERGTSVVIFSDLTNGNFSKTNGLTSFNSNGFSIGSNGGWNNNTSDYASWTFRKAPKFFTCLTYSGTGTAQTISHDLGTTVGTLIVKRTDSSDSWRVYHRGMDATSPQNYFIALNGYSQKTSASTIWNNTAPTDTTFTVGTSSSVNASGGTYVAYLFAHNDGDGEFGDGTQDIIKCGSYSGNGSSTGPVIDLGFEPQWLLIKDATSANNWLLFDNMRGLVTGGNDALLRPNLADAELTSVDLVEATSTGFRIPTNDAGINGSGNTYIYIAIRRGPMAVPTDATDVFGMDDYTGVGDGPVTGFVTDFSLLKQATTADIWYASSRLTGAKTLNTDSTNAEASNTNAIYDRMDGAWTNVVSNYFLWGWKRAPNFFDVVAYTGNGTSSNTVRTDAIPHNLGVQPEMVWVKRRDTTSEWVVAHKDYGSGYLNLTNAFATYSSLSTTHNDNFTETNFKIGAWQQEANFNVSGATYIAYLFASVDGVSKVGSYTGTGATLNIDCGFSNGARFVMIKKASDTGQWVVFDTERGIVAGNDARLFLNFTTAETSNFDDIDPLSSGFTLNNVSLCNASGASYIFYAIA